MITERLNPLHSVDLVTRVVAETGRYFDKDRSTGKSTALALDYIAKAIRNPYTWVAIHDHHKTIIADGLLAQTIKSYIDILRLAKFVRRVHKGEYQIAFGEPNDS